MTKIRLSAIYVMAGLFAGCGPMPVLTPAGPGAEGIVRLWWWLFWLTIIPAVFVLGLLLVAIVYGRPRTAVGEAPASRDAALILGIGGAMPLAVILIMMVQSFLTGQRVTGPPQPSTVRVEIIGHKFWWEVRYPDLGIVTANEIHVPVGESTQLELTSSDVIHSFWVPALHGKIDTLPGRTNVFWLQPDRPGVYRGQCAEFCGTQHALMGLLVIAEPRDGFEDWVTERTRPAVFPNTAELERGLEVFVEGGCHLCHAVNGLVEPRVGNTGPNLTHLAGRRTLAAATVPNTAANLRDWIRNPHDRKPGVRMPHSATMPAGDLDALVAFLNSLR